MIGLVLELIDRLPDALEHLTRDWTLAAQDIGNGAKRDARPSRDLGHRDRPAVWAIRRQLVHIRDLQFSPVSGATERVDLVCQTDYSRSASRSASTIGGSCRCWLLSEDLRGGCPRGRAPLGPCL